MRYVLLTWNPGPNNDEQYAPERWLEEMVLPLQAGRPPTGDRWSIGTNWKAINRGDAVCMLRQGVHGRGIVATGVITRAAFRARHWKLDRPGDAWYVNVAWNRALDLNQMIGVAELEQQVPSFDWSKVYSSGRLVEQDAGEQLATLLGQAPLPFNETKSAGQVFGTAEHNRLVEAEAMALVRAGYERERYVVTDVSKLNRGWDLEARRGRVVCRVEVKGVTGPLPEFFLTPNEHQAAATRSGWVAVVITDVFSAEPAWYEFSGAEVTAVATPTQYRVSGN